MPLTIRPESPRDQAAIHALTKRAFAPMPFAGGDEQDLIDRLRSAGALTISLVAQSDADGEEAIVGYIAFSPAFAADGSPGWYALGPVSVEPDLQKQSVGTKLIETGIAMLRERGAAGCVLVGNPDYYHRFGFKIFSELCPEGEPAEYFQILPLGMEPRTVIGFHPLFRS